MTELDKLKLLAAEAGAGPIVNRLDLSGFQDLIDELREEGDLDDDVLFAVVEGDVAAENWRPPALVTVVLGHLQATGLVRTDSVMAPELDAGGLLLVTGNVNCQDLANGYATVTVIAGDLTVTRLLTTQLEDSALFVNGSLKAGIFYGNDIWAEVGGDIQLNWGKGYCLPQGYTNAREQAVRAPHPITESPIGRSVEWHEMEPQDLGGFDHLFKT